MQASSPFALLHPRDLEALRTTKLSSWFFPFRLRVLRRRKGLRMPQRAQPQQAVALFLVRPSGPRKLDVQKSVVEKPFVPKPLVRKPIAARPHPGRQSALKPALRKQNFLLAQEGARRVPPSLRVPQREGPGALLLRRP